jgi:hypothetical protein
MRASFPLTAERGRIRAVVTALCAVAVMAAVAVVTPPAAHAAFTIAPCNGSAIQGEGSSLQKEAQQKFWASTRIFYSSNGCGSGALSSSPVTYNPDGSGCGIASIGGGPGAKATCSDFEAETAVAEKRDTVTRFAGSDAPLTPTQKAAAEASGGPNPGIIHQIPVAAAAVAVVVHFPDGCELKDPTGGNANTSTGGANDPSGAPTGDTAAAQTLRVHIKADEMEKIWNGTPQTWGNVVPQEDFSNALLTEREGCANTPVIRIVRFDGSGTTYNIKAYFSLLPGAVSAGKNVWNESPVVGDNNLWPLTTSTNNVPPTVVSNVCTDVGHICKAANNGGGEVAAAVNATNGSIGYLDLATARQKLFDVTKETHDHKYWIPLQTINPTAPEGEGPGKKVGTNYVEPTASSGAHINGPTTPGANCTGAEYRGYPEGETDPTLGDWSKAIATGSKDEVTYPACALTYDFAFDDDAPVYGNTQIEQERARTVKDYLTAIESNAGQFELASADYGTLPGNIIQIAQNGVKAIDWNKAAGSGKGNEEVVKPPESKPPTVTTTTTTTIVTPPSNAFSVAGTKIKGKSVVLSLVLPGAGKVQIKAVGGGVTVSNVTASVGGGQGTVTLPISGAAVKKLAKIKGHKLSVKITVTFTPTGGTAASKTKTITITQAAIATKKKKKGKKKG